MSGFLLCGLLGRRGFESCDEIERTGQQVECHQSHRVGDDLIAPAVLSQLGDVRFAVPCLARETSVSLSPAFAVIIIGPAEPRRPMISSSNSADLAGASAGSSE
ncbi:hypothetical protein [Amycolatopsis sp. WAC 01376]|uniref:hypothetical protein n=1 Tax=Amycolatopsis sp. WAC 01376 TaxID=2203195 RepID=UPI0013157E69|nr:hypothetical protein [Amycolatopsis sp. WAC 01376]